MRPLSAVCLLAVTYIASAAPKKDDLPAGAVARLGNLVAPTKVRPLPGDVNVLAFLDGKSLCVGTNAGFKTWDLDKRQPRQERLSGDAAFALAHTRCGDQFYIGSAKKLHRIEPAQSWDSSAEKVDVLAISPDGRRCVFSAGESKLAILDTTTSGKITGTAEFASKPIAVSLSANGRVLAVVTRDGAVRVYNLSATGALESLWTKRVGRSDRGAVQFSPDGRLLAVASAGRVMLLDNVTGLQMAVLDRRFGEGDVRTLAFSPTGRQVAIGSAGPEPFVRIWPVDGGDEPANFVGHLGDVNALAFSPDSKVLASAGTDQAVFLWTISPASPGRKPTTAAEAWDTLDSLDAAVGYRAMGSLLADPGRAVPVIRDGFRGIEAEQARVRRWIAELDHDEFRTREAARRALLKTGLRGAAALTDPTRKRLGAEGEQRVRLILEELESQGLRAPESGLFGEPLRLSRGVRVLETIGGKEARAVLEEAAKGRTELPLTKEAKLALETIPPDR